MSLRSFLTNTHTHTDTYTFSFSFSLFLFTLSLFQTHSHSLSLTLYSFSLKDSHLLSLSPSKAFTHTYPSPLVLSPFCFCWKEKIKLKRVPWISAHLLDLCDDLKHRGIWDLGPIKSLCQCKITSKRPFNEKCTCYLFYLNRFTNLIASSYKCHQFLQYFILYQLWIVVLKYQSLLALYLSGTPSLKTGTSPPSCLYLDNPLYMYKLLAHYSTRYAKYQRKVS